MTTIVFFKSIRPADDKEQLGAKPGEKPQEPAGDAAAAAQKPAPKEAPQAAQKPQGEPREGGEGEEGGEGFGPHNVEAGHHVAFHAGEFKGAGKVTASGEDGCTVADKSGREHRVHWHEVKGHHDGAAEGAAEKGSAE
jgi:hypothetical protein